MSAARAAGPGGELAALVRRPSRGQASAVARFLDGLSSRERIAAVRSVGRRDQRRLYELVEGFREVRLTDLVPANVSSLETVRHFGRNTLPAFTCFEKRFCRPRDAEPEHPDRLFGYNFQSAAILTGPGYFVARADPSRPEVRIDYRELPDERPIGWPEIRPNDRGAARLVYGYLVDTLRGITEQVTIGSATRRGRDIGSWFLLCRET